MAQVRLRRIGGLLLIHVDKALVAIHLVHPGHLPGCRDDLDRIRRGEQARDAVRQAAGRRIRHRVAGFVGIDVMLPVLAAALGERRQFAFDRAVFAIVARRPPDTVDVMGVAGSHGCGIGRGWLAGILGRHGGTECEKDQPDGTRSSKALNTTHFFRPHTTSSPRRSVVDLQSARTGAARHTTAPRPAGCA